jgi:hypothetical protein
VVKSLLTKQAAGNESFSPSTVIASPVPDFVKQVAHSGALRDDRADVETIASDHPNRHPRGALARLRRGAAGQGHRGSEGPWAEADTSESLASSLGALAQLDAPIFVAGTAGLEHRNGAEHDAFFDPASGRVIKLTLPGEFGAWGGLDEYLQRMAWVNELFDDDWLFEGWVRYPNEDRPRLVTSQPWYRVRPEHPEPDMDEIDAYMWRAGFLKAYDGAWIHRDREIVASDAVPKNFVLDVADFVQPIDVILLAPDDEQWERLQNMARSLPQHEAG